MIKRLIAITALCVSFSGPYALAQEVAPSASNEVDELRKTLPPIPVSLKNYTTMKKEDIPNGYFVSWDDAQKYIPQDEYSIEEFNRLRVQNEALPIEAVGMVMVSHVQKLIEGYDEDSIPEEVVEFLSNAKE
jgi:hypothetical protein